MAVIMASDRSKRRPCHFRNAGFPKRMLMVFPFAVSGGKSSTHRTISCKDPFKHAIAGGKLTRGWDGSKGGSFAEEAHALPMASTKFKSSVSASVHVKKQRALRVLDRVSAESKSRNQGWRLH